MLQASIFLATSVLFVFIAPVSFFALLHSSNVGSGAPSKISFTEFLKFSARLIPLARIASIDEILLLSSVFLFSIYLRFSSSFFKAISASDNFTSAASLPAVSGIFISFIEAVSASEHRSSVFRSSRFSSSCKPPISLRFVVKEDFIIFLRNSSAWRISILFRSITPFSDSAERVSFSDSTIPSSFSKILDFSDSAAIFEI